MDIQNRTIGELSHANTRRDNVTTQDTTDVRRCAEFLFSDQLLRRFSTLNDLNHVNETIIEELARVSVTIAPIFLRVWTQVSDQIVSTRERRAA